MEHTIVFNNPSQSKIHHRSSLFYHVYKLKKTITSRIKQFKKMRKQNIQLRYLTNTLFILLSALFFLVFPLLFIRKHFRTFEILITELMNGLMWLLLGVLSTIGLGAGLHTFVLFLGPHIIKVVLTANECESVHFDTTTQWLSWNDSGFEILSYPKSAFQCLQPPKPATILSIFRLVVYPTICWGVGSALGEMPPFFLARAARLNGESIEELQELEFNKAQMSFVQKVKLLVIQNVKHIGFFAIFCLAAIPNPLFDLAGLACGYLGIPFKTFLSATVTAKGFVKAPIQAFFYILFFSSSILDYCMSIIHSYLPVLEPYISTVLNQISKQATNQCTENSNVYEGKKLNIEATINKCIECCNTSMKTSKIHERCIERCKDLTSTTSSYLTLIWNAIVTLAFLYFILSTVYTIYSSRHLYKKKQSNETESNDTNGHLMSA